jgi:hypothetical protein
MAAVVAVAAIAAALSAAATGVSPGGGAARITFGSDLSQPSNADFDCTRLPFDLSNGSRPASGARTCTYTASPNGRAPAGLWPAAGVAQSPLAVPKGSGRLIAMRVSVGAKTGPMQFVVLRTRILRAVFGGRLRVVRACCAIHAVSRVFTPRANAVTTIKVDIAVRHDTRNPRPGGEVLGIDAIGLSVLAPGVPVPINDTLTANVRGGPPVAVFPAARAPGNDVSRLTIGTDRYELLVNADWVDASEAGRQ